MIAPILDTHIWIWYVADTLEKCEMRNADFGLRNWGLRIAKEFETNPSGLGNCGLGERQIRNPHFAIPQSRIS